MRQSYAGNSGLWPQSKSLAKLAIVIGIEAEMVNQLKFVLGWVKYNKSMTIIYCFILSMIACSSILMMQFYYDQSTHDADDVYYDCFYFTESLDSAIAEKILDDLGESGIEVLEYEVAANSPDFDTQNEYTFCAYYVFEKEQQKSRNEYYDYGIFENKAGTYIGENADDILKIDGRTFEMAGEGSQIIGSSGCDYLISTEDYKKYVDHVDVIEIALPQKNNHVKEIISAYSTSYTEEKSTGFLESGFNSIKKTLLASSILILFSLYSALAFVEIMIHLQRKDIAVLYRCGASPKKLCQLYVSEVLLSGVVSFVAGGLLAGILVKVIDFNFDRINGWVYLLGFCVYTLCYYIEATIYVRSTIKHVGIISRESE